MSMGGVAQPATATPSARASTACFMGPPSARDHVTTFLYHLSAVDLAATYRKTEKGKQEVTARALGLEPQVRRLLIMIDGQRDSAELSLYVRAGEFEGTLERLVSEGLVEPAGEPASDHIAREAVANDPAELAAIQTRATAEIRQKISGRMADLLVQEIDSCTTPLELREKLRTLEDSLKKLLGEEEGVTLARRLGMELTRLVP